MFGAIHFTERTGAELFDDLVFAYPIHCLCTASRPKARVLMLPVERRTFDLPAFPPNSVIIASPKVEMGMPRDMAFRA
jgi:hypothetical protein